MPPKQKQQKKGPVYKQSTPVQSLLPSTQKQPPRQCRPIKQPQGCPQIKNIQLQSLLNQFPILFEEWPNQQAIKAMDFGLNSENKFEDSYHKQICQFVKQQLGQQKQQILWKNFQQLQQLQKDMKIVQSSCEEQQQSTQQKKQNNMNQQGNAQQPKQEEAPETQQANKNKQMVVIETYMREQTEQEMERRKQQEAQKAALNTKDKKKGKKQQPKQQGPIQVSDVKMEDIKVKEYMCESARWIGSHLQIIKLRQLKDVYTHEPVWKKIYPQQNGVPQITKSGRYWVKLYYMGKPIKIEVDDKIPINSNNQQLLPISKKRNQRWTIILAKALIKLFHKASPNKSMVGSGMIIYSLTGMITQNVNLKEFSDWSKVINLMSDDNYTQKHVIMSAFNYDNTNKNTPSNQICNIQQTGQELSFSNSTYKLKNKNIDNKVQEQQQQKQWSEQFKKPSQYLDSKIVQGYSYCIGDYFQNTPTTSQQSIFNMAFSKQRSKIQQSLRQQYSQLSKVTLTSKSRQQKLQHRRKKKEIKEKLQQQQKKRVQLINRKIQQHHFVKILGNLQICCEYSHKQVLLAKKCVLNGLEKPPNYEIPVDKQATMTKDMMNKQDAKSGLSASIVKLNKQQISSIEINPSLDDFSNVQKQIKDVLPRNDKGIWIKDQDLLASFDELQIFYNPNSSIFQQNKNIQYVEFKGVNQFSCDQNAQILIIEKKGNPHLEQQQQENIQESQINEQKQKQQNKIKLLFGFSYQKSKWDTLHNPYCMLQKFDFDSYRTISTVNKLSEIMNSTYLELKNQNTIFKLYTMSKGRYAYWISCSVPYKLLSISKYLEEYQGYTSKDFTIEYPPLEASNYFPLARIKIKQSKQDNVLIMKFKNTPTFKVLEKYLTFKLVSTLDTQNPSYTSQAVEGVVQKCCQSSYIVSQYTRIQLPCQQDGKISYLIISAYPQKQNIGDGCLQLQILSKCSNINIDEMLSQQQQIQPYKIVQKYSINKYANIMKQRIYYTNAKDINVSLYFKMVEGEEGQPIAGGGKGAKKGAKQEAVCQIIEKNMKQKRLIHLKVMKNNNILYYAKGYNQISIPNLTLQEKEGEQQHQYYIQASFDLREWPEANIASQETSKIYWVCQVYGDDSIALVKDTKQQQKQKQTKKSWEDKQPGRAEKAKKSRLRFLLECKQEKGQDLTEEQLQIVNAPRLTKKQLLQEQKKNQDKKGGKGGKKDDKKAGKDKKQEVVEQNKDERPLPKSQDNFMTEIKEFLKNLQDCQVINEKLEENQEPRIRSAEQQQAIKEGAAMSAENRVGQLIRNIQMRQTLKIRQKDKVDKLKILLEDSRASFTQSWTKYIQFRIQDKQKDSVSQQKQKLLIDIIKTATNPEKTLGISEADLIKMINQYKQIEGFNQKLADVGQMIRKNIKIGNVVQKINTSLAGWEVQELKNIKQEIKQIKIQGIQQSLLKQVNEMLEEVQKNPAIIQQKQAELKKAKKGGKK